MWLISHSCCSKLLEVLQATLEAAPPSPPQHGTREKGEQKEDLRVEDVVDDGRVDVEVEDGGTEVLEGVVTVDDGGIEVVEVDDGVVTTLGLLDVVVDDGVGAELEVIVELEVLGPPTETPTEIALLLAFTEIETWADANEASTAHSMYR